eukprot:scaffold98_cov307-Prasinococcus_capsulatus_cf.AAC.4
MTLLRNSKLLMLSAPECHSLSPMGCGAPSFAHCLKSCRPATHPAAYQPQTHTSRAATGEGTPHGCHAAWRTHLGLCLAGARIEVDLVGQALQLLRHLLGLLSAALCSPLGPERVHLHARLAQQPVERLVQGRHAAASCLPFESSRAACISVSARPERASWSARGGRCHNLQAVGLLQQPLQLLGSAAQQDLLQPELELLLPGLTEERGVDAEPHRLAQRLLKRPARGNCKAGWAPLAPRFAGGATVSAGRRRRFPSFRSRLRGAARRRGVLGGAARRQRWQRRLLSDELLEGVAHLAQAVGEPPGEHLPMEGHHERVPRRQALRDLLHRLGVGAVLQQRRNTQGAGLARHQRERQRRVPVVLAQVHPRALLQQQADGVQVSRVARHHERADAVPGRLLLPDGLALLLADAVSQDDLVVEYHPEVTVRDVVIIVVALCVPWGLQDGGGIRNEHELVDVGAACDEQLRDRPFVVLKIHPLLVHQAPERDAGVGGGQGALLQSIRDAPGARTRLTVADQALPAHLRELQAGEGVEEVQRQSVADVDAQLPPGLGADGAEEARHQVLVQPLRGAFDASLEEALVDHPLRQARLPQRLQDLRPQLRRDLEVLGAVGGQAGHAGRGRRLLLLLLRHAVASHLLLAQVLVDVRDDPLLDLRQALGLQVHAHDRRVAHRHSRIQGIGELLAEDQAAVERMLHEPRLDLRQRVQALAPQRRRHGKGRGHAAPLLVLLERQLLLAPRVGPCTEPGTPQQVRGARSAGAAAAAAAAAAGSMEGVEEAPASSSRVTMSPPSGSSCWNTRHSSSGDRVASSAPLASPGPGSLSPSAGPSTPPPPALALSPSLALALALLLAPLNDSAPFTLARGASALSMLEPRVWMSRSHRRPPSEEELVGLVLVSSPASSATDSSGALCSHAARYSASEGTPSPRSSAGRRRDGSPPSSSLTTPPVHSCARRSGSPRAPSRRSHTARPPTHLRVRPSSALRRSLGSRGNASKRGARRGARGVPLLPRRQ